MTATRIPYKKWNVVYELDDTGETVIYDETRAELVVLNQTGAAVWYLVDGERSAHSIAEFIATEATDAPEIGRIEQDVEAFLAEMEGRGAIAFRLPGEDEGGEDEGGEDAPA